MFRPVKKHNQITTEAIILFCTQTAMVLKAGIPLYDGVHAIYEDLPEDSFKAVIKIVDEEISKNAPLHIAMKKAEAFPQYAVGMIEIAEFSGRLEDVLNALADYYQREKTIKMRIKSAVLYPLTLFIMMLAVMGLLVFKVLPMFNGIMNELGAELPQSAAALMNIGITVGAWSFLGLILAFILGVMVFAAYKTPKGYIRINRLLEVFPVTKGLYSNIAAGRFSSAMALMLASGVDTSKALQMSAELTENSYVSNKIMRCNQMLEEGKSFTSALSEADIFPNLFSRILSIGFKTGAIDSVMGKIADMYDEKIDNSIGNITALVEPVLISVLAIIVGAILISVLLPLTGMMLSIG